MPLVQDMDVAPECRRAVQGREAPSNCRFGRGRPRSVQGALAVRQPTHREVPRLALNQKEAAESLGMSVDHFERHVKRDLPVVYSGSLRLYPITELQRWLGEHSLRGGRRVA